MRVVQAKCYDNGSMRVNLSKRHLQKVVVPVPKWMTLSWMVALESRNVAQYSMLSGVRCSPRAVLRGCVEK